MNILIFMSVLFGIRALNFVLKQFVVQHFFSEKSKKQIQILILALLIVTILTFSLYEMQVVALLFAVVLGMNVVYHFMVFKREKSFKDNFCHHVDQIILEMRSGVSFRIAFERTIAKAKPFESVKLKKMLDLIQFRGFLSEKNKFIFNLVTELSQVDRHSHNAIQRLDVLRLKLRTQSEFRKKKNQAVLQIRAQGLILTGLYIVTLFFIMKVLPNSLHFSDFLMSFSLFVIGGLIILYYGRSYRWKV